MIAKDSIRSFYIHCYGIQTQLKFNLNIKVYSSTKWNSVCTKNYFDIIRSTVVDSYESHIRKSALSRKKT